VQAANATPPAAKAPGRGIVPVSKSAQRGSAGGIAAGGAVAADQAQTAGASSGVLVAILVVAAACAVGAWLFWRWRQRRAQLAVALPPVRSRDQSRLQEDTQ
jgi:hypothetical protein